MDFSTRFVKLLKLPIHRKLKIGLNSFSIQNIQFLKSLQFHKPKNPTKSADTTMDITIFFCLVWKFELTCVVHSSSPSEFCRSKDAPGSNPEFCRLSNEVAGSNPDPEFCLSNEVVGSNPPFAPSLWSWLS